jgi:predicted ester cyclase
VPHVSGGDLSCNPAGTRAIAVEWTAAFPDWRFDLLALVAEADRVVAHMPYSGTHHGTIVGLEPTRAHCFVDEMVMFRIADGKIAEAREVFDEAGMWRQLGVSVLPGV